MLAVFKHTRSIFPKNFYFKPRLVSTRFNMDPAAAFKQNFDQDVPRVTTQIIKIDPNNVAAHLDDFKYPTQLIHEGQVVAFPTETVYGLGANALDASAVKKIFLTKKRPGDNPLIVHVSSEEMLAPLVSEIPEGARVLMKEFWPGPLTILFPTSDRVPVEVTCGQPTVAIRMPVHPIARKLIEISGVPIAAPSANLSGRPSPTSADHVYQDLKDRCACIIDGGECDVGLESTVVDLKRKKILRPGGVTLEQLEKFIPGIEVYSQEKDTEGLVSAPPTPGLKYRHYSPQAQVFLIEGTNYDRMKILVSDIFNEYQAEKKTVGIIHTQNAISYPDEIVKSEFCKLVVLETSRDVAKGLFKALRGLDADGVSVIIMEGINESDEGLAVMNRIRKAASTILQC